MNQRPQRIHRNPYPSSNRARTPKARRRLRHRERLLDRLASTVHPQTRHRQAPQEQDEVEQLEVPWPSAVEEGAEPESRAACAEAHCRGWGAGDLSGILFFRRGLGSEGERVDLHVVAEEHEWGERVGELHDADGGDEGGDGLHLRDRGADNESYFQRLLMEDK